MLLESFYQCGFGRKGYRPSDERSRDWEAGDEHRLDLVGPVRVGDREVEGCGEGIGVGLEVLVLRVEQLDIGPVVAGTDVEPVQGPADLGNDEGVRGIFDLQQPDHRAAGIPGDDVDLSGQGGNPKASFAVCREYSLYHRVARRLERSGRVPFECTATAITDIRQRSAEWLGRLRVAPGQHSLRHVVPVSAHCSGAVVGCQDDEVRA